MSTDKLTYTINLYHVLVLTKEGSAYVILESTSGSVLNAIC